MDYLVMRLYAPISSWGTLAVGEDRPTVNYPTRSAVLGLLSAALGIKRSETQKLKDLANSIGIASKTYSEGTILRDYHTIQTPTAGKGVKFFTRKQELQSAKVETILSSRDYREDGLWVVAIWLKANANSSMLEYQFDLQQLQQALKYPKFTLYLGRKSCPLSLPLSPQIVTASHLKTALDVSIDELLVTSSQDETAVQPNAPTDKRNGFTKWQINELIDTIVSDRYLPTTIDYTVINEQSNRLRQVTYHWEGEIELMFKDTPPANIFTHHHWDEPTDRKQWQFTQRIGHQWTTLEPINNAKEVKKIMSNTPDKGEVL
ncbi:type I-E CRISPR-associated protein Cas5/CasD [Psychrobacter jeotgali]|uniref:type I-E CRISPR-associated protein Cas5/CasD n=1 Tax=Psychrobacter jeotgali TaxID=179010 RepID=UPI0019191175|nr:type I-E CRISPR-associated protein Cas5/CasD [Psychrobacter jeotgali]